MLTGVFSSLVSLGRCEGKDCMGSDMLMLLCFAGALAVTAGLQCYSCTAFKYDEMVPACFGGMEDDLLTSVTCPTPPAGKVAKCSSRMSETLSAGPRLTYVSRRCDVTDTDTADGCTTSYMSLDTYTSIDHICYCSSDNCNRQTFASPTPSPGGLQCYKCDALYGARDEPNVCIDSVTSAMPLVTCPTAPKGQVATCLLSRKEELLADEPVTSVFRGCAVTDLTTATDGCSTEYLNTYFTSKNDTCYCSSSNCNGKTVREISAAIQGSEGLKCYACRGETEGPANTCVDADVKSMLSQPCAVPPAGQVAKCLHRYQDIFGLWSSIKRVTRGCVFVPTHTKDGCTTKQPSGISSLGDGPLSECYCSTDNCNN